MQGINPRRPLDDNKPNGYMESDRDFVLNNIEACVEYLEASRIDACVEGVGTMTFKEAEKQCRKVGT